jgi:phospholipase C
MKSKRGPETDRRTALKALSAAALAPLAQACPTSPTEPDETPTPSPTGDPRDVVTHIVVLMMENRSFDQFLGALKLVENRTDVDGLEATMSNLTSDGTEIFVHPAEENCVADPPHGWDSCRRQFNGGANDGFVTEYEPDADAGGERHVMGYFDREKLSAYYAFADRHTICDRWFCSQLSSTWPNRYYSHAATCGGVEGNDLPEGSFPAIYDRLDDAGIDWGVYFGNAPFVVLLPTVDASSSVKPLSTFFEDAASGALPTVTVIEPSYGRNDDHPPTHPVAGQILVASIYEALRTSPLRDRFVLLITYDEHGGFYDHVPPGRAPDERAADDFDQLGFRVPSLVVGPWTKEGYVSHVDYDHTSMLATIERFFDLPSLTMRDGAANDLWDCFDLDRIASGTPIDLQALPVIEADEDEIYAEECAGGIFRDAPGRMHQPELEAWLDAHPGHPLDRRAQTDADYEDLLRRAEAMGVLRRR